MRTDDLIADLSARLEPVPAGAMLRRLFAVLALGFAGSVVVMLLVLGLRADIATAIVSFGMWTKLVYTFALAGFGIWLVERLGRPGAPTLPPAAMLALPLLVLIGLSWQQMTQPGADMHALVMGHSADVCAANILLVAAPTLVAAFWALRRMAPTRLGLAGAGAGLMAGAAGAFVYSFHCTEGTAPFIAIWYTLGIVVTAAIGAALGRWALRW